MSFQPPTHDQILNPGFLLISVQNRNGFDPFVTIQIVLAVYHLQVGNANVEALVHVGMPYQSNIGNKKCAKIALQ